ncbi:hypothetical protein A2480_00865 [Candidatus Uhrbacteria bacterium RIFOXYC2_FULL_47_19]|uniref:Uncharacterized protein n=1 Tax=Candidatus Uhrbacteria bacterium RIFOXYC2_FULL_47_19 TaxID=1802424 RepID=A0A1F7WFK3_9BACT|nr:MAG: hypothetical protein A2480_00865 [Candidatus Uhrbacteria bacterium RIFOXYC2_FULL_47_19]HCC22126.1 hypothetical protein [Candidatus Uhrbacteria bacterium]
MALTKICEQCDTEMRLIPAGISKTKNKPYSAFWTCDKRTGGCGATANAEGEGTVSPVVQSCPAAKTIVQPDRLASIESKLDRILELLER